MFSDNATTNNSVNQSGKSGGDVRGIAGAGSFAGADGGGASAMGSFSGSGLASAGGGMADSGASAMAGGDVTDNTSIGNININS